MKNLKKQPHTALGLTMYTTTATDEPSTHLPEIAPEGVLISEDLTLPPGLEALNLVTEKIEAPSEKALHLPDAEPLLEIKLMVFSFDMVDCLTSLSLSTWIFFMLDGLRGTF